MELNNEKRILNIEGNLSIETKGQVSVLAIVTKDANITINNYGNLVVEMKVISKDNVKINIIVNNEKNAKVRIDSINFNSIEIDGTMNVKKENSESRIDLLCLNLGNKVKLIPKLNVKLKNVKVGHSALTTNIDENSVFYLTSKGLNEKEAIELIIKTYLLRTKEFKEEIEDIKELTASLPNLS